MFKVNNKDTRRQWRRSGVNFEHFTPCSSVSTVNFEYVIADWDTALFVGSTNYLSKNVAGNWDNVIAFFGQGLPKSLITH